MGKVILYPFSIDQDNKVSYTRALNLARDLSAKMVCFSVTSAEENQDDTYLHLLQLNGHYQVTEVGWKPLEVEVESIVKVGEWEPLLSKYLEDRKIDIMINQSPIQRFEDSVLAAMIKNAKQEVKIFSFLE